MEYKMKKVKVVKYQDHPELENKVVEYVIMNSEKIKPKMKKPIVPRKPKQPRMTIDQLALEMRAGFATINKRIDKLEDEVVGINAVLKRNNLH
jgi:hypothetical protein